MSRIIDDKENETGKEESVDNYKELFLPFVEKNPTLKEALDQMYQSQNLNNVESQSNRVIAQCKKELKKRFKKIKKNNPNITEEEALIICTYTYQDNGGLSPYTILNKNLVANDRKNGIRNISKYFFILLKSLRNLTPFNANGKILYRAIRQKVITETNKKNSNYIPYQQGNVKKFWGFTSTSKDLTSNFLGDAENEENKKIGTKFVIHGYIVGYDISVFSCFEDEKEVLLEPERKFEIEQVCDINDVIDVTCKILKTPLVLEEIIKIGSQNVENNKNSPNNENIVDKIERNDNTINDDNRREGIAKDNNNVDKITMVYKIDKERDGIQILGEEFVKANKENCKIIINQKTYDICERIEYDKYDINKEDKLLKIMLTGINKITDASCMFCYCFTLQYLPDIFKWDTQNVKSMYWMFFGCSSLESLPDISKWDTTNVENMDWMFGCCSSLKSLPDISKWNTEKVNSMSGMFGRCYSLKSLPDISKWNTGNVVSMRGMFYECKSLESLPDISKWDIRKVNMSVMFYQCAPSLNIPSKFK